MRFVLLVSVLTVGCAAGADAFDNDPPGPTLVDASGVTVGAVVAYQGVEIILEKDGVPTSAPGLVAGRDAVFRVFALPTGTRSPKVTARLTFGAHDPIELEQAVTAPDELDLASTLNFKVPGAQLTPGVSYKVELLQPAGDGDGDGDPGAHFPADGAQPLTVTSVGQTLKITIVPIAYGADGSNRMPDVSAEQLKRYHDRFLQLYPVPEIDVVVGEAFTWSRAVSRNGAGWSELLDALSQRHVNAGNDAENYWFGAFAPTVSSGQYCNAGCVSGLGTIGAAHDTYSHTAIGLGFPDTAGDTAVHEIGHNHGRQHAPCGGAAQPDPQYPYPQAAIGVAGYDLLGDRLIRPEAKDMMAYCTPVWISDYNFFAIQQRIQQVNGARVIVPESARDLEYERVRVEDGAATWLSSVRLATPPLEDATPIELDEAAGPVTVDARFYAYDHLDGGVYLWPKRAATRGATLPTRSGKVRARRL